MSQENQTDFKKAQLPDPVFYPPFNITRASHTLLSVRDLEESVRFYTSVIGLLVTELHEGTAYLRGAEEACHHSLVLRTCAVGEEPQCDAIGFRVLTDSELDKAFEWAAGRNVIAQWVDRPFQSRTLRLIDPAGTPIELCAHMPVVDRQMGHKEASLAFAKRLDHFQVLNPNVDHSTPFYVDLGFRISDAIVIGGELEACFFWRKGSVSDLVLMEGAGPRLHHTAYLVRKPDDILRACDMIGELGFSALMTEEGPGRHGMDGAYYIYFRDPDGHRVELFDGHYQTIDSELEPKQYPPNVAAPPWGLPTLESWFEEGSVFTDTEQNPPRNPRFAPTMESYIAEKSGKS